ncbi:MAG: phenylacetate--CoA ligase family protein [Flexilinea sp.]
MNYNFIKIFYEKLPKVVKRWLSFFFINIIVNNPTFKKTWNEIDVFEKLPESEQKKLQFVKLKATLEYAYDHVPYYRELFDEYSFHPQNIESLSDLSVIPILEKSKIGELNDKLFSDEPINYYETFTGGSTGKAASFLLDKDSIYKERAYICHYLSKFGYNYHHSKTVAFFGQNKDQDYYYSPLKNEIIVSPFRLLSEDSFNRTIVDIQKFDPNVVAGYPSAIYQFSRLLKKNNISFRANLVVFYAENYSEEEKEYIEDILGCKAISYYGHTERAVFASINERGCIFSDNYGYTELIPTDEKDLYQVVCTGFISRKMPLIRYATDDVVKIHSDGRFELIGHKRSEVHLIGKNGVKIFKGAMTMHIKEFQKIRIYQYVQSEVGKVDLNIVEDEPLSPNDLLKIKGQLDRRCENILDIKINIVEKVILTPRGKFSWAVSFIENPDNIHL